MPKEPYWNLIHRDYIIIGGEVHIDIFDDRIEFNSPGGCLMVR